MLPHSWKNDLLPQRLLDYGEARAHWEKTHSLLLLVGVPEQGFLLTQRKDVP